MAPIEGRGVIATLDHRMDQLVLHTASQMPHIVRNGLADCLGLPQEKIRVVSPDVGGGFGYKAILLAEAVDERRMALDDHVAKYVPELARGRDIRRINVGQLAIHTSGLLLPQDHPPWPTEHYTLASFFDALNDWQVEAGHEPGRQHMYTHAGYILLQLALERGLGAPISELLARRILDPLGMTSSLIPMQGSDDRGELLAALLERAVQGYAADGRAIGAFIRKLP